MVINRQKGTSINLGAMRAFVRKARKCLGLGRRDFNVCFVRDRDIARLNGTYRSKPRATDVLSFPWQPGCNVNGSFSTGLSSFPLGSKARTQEKARGSRMTIDLPELANFLGDIVISAQTARRNAQTEGHSTAREIRWLILHGLLHLMGHDHATDTGEMTALEYSLRAKLKT